MTWSPDASVKIYSDLYYLGHFFFISITVGAYFLVFLFGYFLFSLYSEHKRCHYANCLLNFTAVIQGR